MRNLRCPLIKPRPTGGTFYTFGSALEDIGLNINTSDYKVELSHYVILDLPDFDMGGRPCGESAEIAPGDLLFGSFFQNTILNTETLLRASDSYDFSSKETVSENVFWDSINRWIITRSSWGLMIDMNYDRPIIKDKQYVRAAPEFIKGIGTISGGAQRSDSYGIYNETYIQIPASYKQTPVYFKYEASPGYGAAYNPSDTIYGITAAEMSDATDGSGKIITETGLSANAKAWINSEMIYPFAPQMKIEFSTDVLAEIYGVDSITYDEMATQEGLPEEYKFNALLIYYSIYNANGDVVATNPYGLLLLNSAEESKVDYGRQWYKFKELDKKASNSTTTGNSYAFRLNIKTSSAYSTNITVEDNSVVGYSQTLDYNDMVRYLGDAVNIMSSNSQLIAKLVSENQSLKELLIQAIDKIDTLDETIEGTNGIKARLTNLEMK